MAKTMRKGMTTIRRQAPWYERGGKNKIRLELMDYPANRYGRFAWRHSWPIDAARPDTLVTIGPLDATRRVTLHELIFGRGAGLSAA
jgi:hypothetical protein